METASAVETRILFIFVSEMKTVLYVHTVLGKLCTKISAAEQMLCKNATTVAITIFLDQYTWKVTYKNISSRPNANATTITVAITRSCTIFLDQY
jgi:hypothetical protein